MSNISAQAIAQALAQFDSHVHPPTDQQRAIIESTNFSPTLVIAGAGSGKTETMAARVLWLVANGHAKPSEILGLTFTNKAAGELHQRIRKRLRQLQKTNLLTPTQWLEIGDISAQVSTYHAYAGKILREDGIKLGLDAGAEPIGEAATWQLAKKVLLRHEGFTNLGEKSLNVLVDELIKLSDSLNEHSLSHSTLRSHAEDILSTIEQVLPSRGNTVSKTVRDFANTVSARIELLPVVTAFNEEKQRLGWLTFNDQMNYASHLLTSDESLAAPIRDRERSRNRFVILDEFQDTSPVQIQFLASLYGNDHRVTAVGDPNQAIYEWRGAGSETLGQFPIQFSTTPKLVPVLELTTSWRNDKNILNLANLMIEEIGQARKNLALSSESSSISVSQLAPSNKAGQGQLLIGNYLTYIDEAKQISEVIAEKWSQSTELKASGGKGKSFAVLVRAKSLIPEIEEQLRSRGLPVEIVGFDGLIHLPEIADLIAMLRILLLPDSGAAFMRIATGPYLNLGAKDINALGRFLSFHKKNQRPMLSRVLTDYLASDEIESDEGEDFFSGSIIEALESLTPEHRYLFSPTGYNRLTSFKEDLRRLRRNLYGSITESIMEVVEYLHLETELELRDGREKGKRHLTKFLDEAAKFARTGGTLFDFLSWIKVAESEEGGLKPASAEVDAEVIQILTIHSAKGLEWDVVWVPGLVEKKFPNDGKTTPQWTRHIGTIPSHLRRDSSLFKHFTWPSELNSARVGDALDDVNEYWKSRHELEEYRLAYVAFTRARSTLILSSAQYYGQAKEANEESRFSLAARTLLQTSTSCTLLSDSTEKLDENPLLANPEIVSWPPQREIISLRTAQKIEYEEIAYRDISELMMLPQEKIGATLHELIADTQILINESKYKSNDLFVSLPSRLSTSALINLAHNPQDFALNIRRPLPRAIDPYAKRGTAFHTWVENYYKSAQLISDDEMEILQPFDKEDFALEELKEKWLASGFATMRPFLIEMPFDLSFESIVLRGRIDAIFKNGDRYLIVDWKTGRSKKGDNARLAAIQLATYQMAFSRLHNVDLGKIDAAFYYVGESALNYPETLLTQDELIALLTENLSG